MKDKRTYTNLKEYGEDMSHENETKIKHEVKEDRGPGDLSLLIEMHKKEIWDWKQKESNWIKTDNLLQGSRKIIDELSAKLVDQLRIITELQYDNNTYKKEIEKLLAEKNK
jgi:hypothetical protein|tara:strand:- start:540 stop:872 length:333 start_codon:yes stop_codon:yes gene_type:complete